MPGKIKSFDQRIQKVLLWSAVFALLSYLIFMLRIFDLYTRSHGGYPYLFISSMVVLYLLFGSVAYVLWAKLKFSKTLSVWGDKSYLNYYIKKLNGQRKMIVFYLLMYVMIVVMSALFFYFSIDHSLPALIRLIMPVGILTFTAGLYFIISFSLQKKKLDQLCRRLDDIYFAEKHHQN